MEINNRNSSGIAVCQEIIFNVQYKLTELNIKAEILELVPGTPNGNGGDG